MKMKYLVDNKTKRLIEQIVNDGDRAEVVISVNGLRVLRCSKKEEMLRNETRTLKN